MSSANNPIIYEFINNMTSKVKTYRSLNKPTNQFKKEQKIVQEIYDKLRNKNSKLKNNKYILLSDIIASLPSAEDINDLLKNFFDELKKHEYTDSELLAISTLLYRLSNIKFATVELPEQFPNHSQSSISNIYKNKQPNHYEYIDKKIQKIVKNLISHYKLDIKNNKNYNRSNAAQLALKLKKILLSFIIDYTRPESSKPLEVISVFSPGSTRKQMHQFMKNNPKMLPRIIGKN